MSEDAVARRREVIREAIHRVSCDRRASHDAAFGQCSVSADAVGMDLAALSGVPEGAASEDETVIEAEDAMGHAIFRAQLEHDAKVNPMMRDYLSSREQKRLECTCGHTFIRHSEYGCWDCGTAQRTTPQHNFTRVYASPDHLPQGVGVSNFPNRKCEACGEPWPCPNAYKSAALRPVPSPEPLDVREALASLEHDQWMKWAQSVMDSEPVSDARRERWARFMVPYADLDEPTKDYDREWADRALAILAAPQPVPEDET